MLLTPWGRFEPTRPCPICGQPWSPWVGSRLPCHARCLLDDEAKLALMDLIATDPRATLTAVAEAMGISISALRSALRHAPESARAP